MTHGTDTGADLIAVAITGGIGSGKTELLNAFRRRGLPVLSGDDVVHRLLEENEDVRVALRARYGRDVFFQGGAVNRAAVAAIVFGDDDELAWLEGLLHPLATQSYRDWRNSLRRSADLPSAVFAEVPLLYETGGQTHFDKVVVITAAPEVRAARTSVRADGRERRFLPDEEKIRQADFAYVNDRSLAALDDFAAEVLRALEEERCRDR